MYHQWDDLVLPYSLHPQYSAQASSFVGVKTEKDSGSSARTPVIFVIDDYNVFFSFFLLFSFCSLNLYFWKQEDSFWELVKSFCRVSPGDQTRGIHLGSKRFCELRHLA